MSGTGSGYAGPPQVVVRQSGWSQTFLGHFASDCSYGLVLSNRSKTLDAMRVTTRVDFLSTTGAVLDFETNRITGIPANGMFVVGGICEPRANRVARIRATATVGKTQPRALVLPVVTDAHIATLSGATLFTVVGTLTNPYPQSIDTHDPIGYAVMFSSSGKIIGGGESPPFDVLNYPYQTVPPGGSAPLIFYPGPMISPASIASVRIAVDPRYVPSK